MSPRALGNGMMWVEGWGHLPGQLVVVSGPSGCGKSTLIKRVLERADVNIQLSVSVTTRDCRPDEVDGVDYHFKQYEDFRSAAVRGEFLETAEYNAHLYGTPSQPVYEALSAGKSVLLEIEVNGALQVRNAAPSALFVFIRTPTFRILEERLRRRSTESEPVILGRLRRARVELAEAHWYDYQLVNDDFDVCAEQFMTLLKSYGCGG
jgi:guanylate kinase